MRNLTKEFRHTLSHLETLCAFAERYDKGLEGLSALSEAQVAVRHTVEALNKLETALDTITDIYSDTESYVLMTMTTTNPKSLTGLILADYERALTASCILDSMKNEHDFFSQKGLEELLVCLQAGLTPERLEF